MEREGGEGGAGCGRRVNSWRSHNQSASNLVVILPPHHDSHPSSLQPPHHTHTTTTMTHIQVRYCPYPPFHLLPPPRPSHPPAHLRTTRRATSPWVNLLRSA